MENEFASHRGVKRRVRNKSPECERATRLDKYYTTDAVAAECLAMMEPFLNADTLLIEPSAGAGSFLGATGRDIIGLDIDPDDDQVITRDFLTLPTARRKSIAFVGNPPFGKKGALATQFINRGLEIAGLVGFIVPITMRRWIPQKKINADARLVLDRELPTRSYTFCGREVDVRCVFQIWSIDSDLPDLRLKEKPPQTHPDFDMWQYNLTKDAQHVFHNDWDFAVVRQGSYDYSKKVWSFDGFCPRRQYQLVKASSPEVLRRLLKIDYRKLSLCAGMKPGISKSDVVTAYEVIKKAEAI